MTSLTIQTVEQELKSGVNDPGRLAVLGDWLAGMSSSIMEREEALIDVYTDFFNTQRPNYKSDKATDMAWDATEQGKELRHIKSTRKRMARLISSINKHLQVKNNEAFNHY